MGKFLLAGTDKKILKKSNSLVQIMVVVAIMAAMYFLLSLFSIKAGNIRITLTSVVTVVMAYLCGPCMAAVSVFIGEFLSQLLNYGIGITTILWLIPPVLRAILVGNLYWLFRKVTKNGVQEINFVRFLVVNSLSSIVVTIANTGIMALDALILGYYTKAYVFAAFFVRLGIGIITSVIVSFIAFPIIMRIRGYIGGNLQKN